MLNTEDAVEHDPQANQESLIQPIKKFLQTNEIPKDENPKAFRMKVSQFIILNDILYKKSLAGPYFRCLEDFEIREVLKDIHEGDYGNHTRGRSLFSKILRTGYYWPTMRKYAMFYAQKCDTCQRHSNTLQ
ncbi:uncharacterized protein LOC143533725 [Bidens hawaiensis]|uniref:uncharacterized protein LOC143533725 n=1 Tax=Bidens hawaiensis TaxID=980011 RepID=UPI00404A89C3